jgi:subtilisin family serine protease
MRQVQVLVNKLNRRKYPVTDFSDKRNVIEVMNKGYAFEVAGEIVNSAGTWYADKEGYFSWAGGLGEFPHPAAVEVSTAYGISEPTPDKMSWAHRFCNIPSIWDRFKTYGEGVTVAVFDSGIDVAHQDLKTNILDSSTNMIDGSAHIEDSDGHGTKMAGIIAGAGADKVFGVAPGAKLLVVKATEKELQDDLPYFTRAAEYISSVPGVDIVSISYAFTCSNYDVACRQKADAFQQAIQKCIDSHKIVLAAIGDDHYPDPQKPDGTDPDSYPACFNNGLPFKKGVLAVGAHGQDGKLCSFSNRNRHISFIAPGDDSVLTTGLNGSSAMGAKTSIATAFSAGCIALMLSYLKQKRQPIDIAKCMDALLTTCDPVENTTGPDNGSGHGRLNIVKAFEKIKTSIP